MANNLGEYIELGHGSGGFMMKELLEEVFFKSFGNIEDDAAVIDDIAFSTDSYVITPQFFPGGNIGKLAVCGTVNDISTSGAVPKAISVSMILEQGYPIDKLKEISKTINITAKEANVKIVTGDTKVVEKGKVDGIFINTAGIGKTKFKLSGRNCKPGDKVIISGTVGDHGMAIMSTRLNFESDIQSDAAPLNQMIQDVLKVAPNTRCFRDPTRGGLASTLNEFAEQSNVDIIIHDVPIKPQVQSACDMLGLDPLQVANEGKIVAIVPPDEAKFAYKAMKANKYGKGTAIIGVVEKSTTNRVLVKTPLGTTRILDMLVGEQLPRIC